MNDMTLITDAPTDSESWTLDSLGNWTDYTVNGDTQTDATNGQNELTDSTLDGTDNTQSFDNDGNTTSDISGNAYTYDAWNRMVSASAYGETLSYDANGRQIGVSVTGSATVWSYYSTSGQVLETDADGSVINQNVWGIDYVNHLIERDDNSTSGDLGLTGSGLGVRIYAITDANYNVTGLVDTSANVLQRFMYGAYGTMTVLDANYGSTTDGYNWQIGFQGGMTDPVTGLVHFDARDYNPATGRWMEQDPTGAAYVDGANLYQFARSNPITGGDPSGRCWRLLDGSAPQSGSTGIGLSKKNVLIITVAVAATLLIAAAAPEIGAAEVAPLAVRIFVGVLEYQEAAEAEAEAEIATDLLIKQVTGLVAKGLGIPAAIALGVEAVNYAPGVRDIADDVNFVSNYLTSAGNLIQHPLNTLNNLFSNKPIAPSTKPIAPTPTTPTPSTNPLTQPISKSPGPGYYWDPDC